MLKQRRAFFTALALAVGSLTASLGSAAEKKPLRDAAAAGSPLAKYDPNRELARGEVKPEEPDKPLRRFLYFMSNDSSACGTYDGGGILVLDIDNGHRPVKRITSDLLLQGPRSGNSLGGVRWASGSAVNDRLYYNYWGGVDRDLVGGHEKPEQANAVIGCVDLRTNQVLWEQATYNACAAGVSADGRWLVAVPHWSRNNYGKTTILNALTGQEIMRIVDTPGYCHGAMQMRNGLMIPHCWKNGAIGVVDPAARTNTPFLKHFGLQDDPAWREAWALTHDGVNCNGRCTRFWLNSYVDGRSAPPAIVLFDVAERRIDRAYYSRPLQINANHPDSSVEVYGVGGKRPVLSPDERWICYGNPYHFARVEVFDARPWPPMHVGSMGIGLASRQGTDPVSGRMVGGTNKAGGHFSADGRLFYTSDSWFFDMRTWKPAGLMRNESGALVRTVKSMEVHFRGRDVVYVADRESGFYEHPENLFPPSEDKTLPTAIADLKAAVGEPAPRWAGGAIVVEVKLAWSPATDDEGVQRYAVWRDGELIGNCLGVNPGLDPAMSAEDQAEYEKQAGKFEPNTFKARYLEPGKTYRFEVEPIDFAQNRGPRAAINVEVPAVSDAKRLALVRARIEAVAARATANRNDKNVRDPCVEAVLALLTTHKVAKDEALAVLDRLAPLAEGDDRDARSTQAKIEAKRKELNMQTSPPKEGRR